MLHLDPLDDRLRALHPRDHAHRQGAGRTGADQAGRIHLPLEPPAGAEEAHRRVGDRLAGRIERPRHRGGGCRPPASGARCPGAPRAARWVRARSAPGPARACPVAARRARGRSASAWNVRMLRVGRRSAARHGSCGRAEISEYNRGPRGGDTSARRSAAGADGAGVGVGTVAVPSRRSGFRRAACRGRPPAGSINGTTTSVPSTISCPKGSNAPATLESPLAAQTKVVCSSMLSRLFRRTTQFRIRSTYARCPAGR